jgi:hypothetical protein
MQLHHARGTERVDDVVESLSVGCDVGHCRRWHGLTPIGNVLWRWVQHGVVSVPSMEGEMVGGWVGGAMVEGWEEGREGSATSSGGWVSSEWYLHSR